MLAVLLATTNTRGQNWQIEVDRARIELATHGFSGRCSTN
jgi:hypothetical protein